MCAVDCQIGADRSTELSVAGSCYRAEPAPEQTVMHEQQINILSYRKFDRRFTRVHRGAYLCHSTIVSQLQTINRIRVIFDFPDPQKIIEKVTNGAEHGRKQTVSLRPSVLGIFRRPCGSHVLSREGRPPCRPTFLLVMGPNHYSDGMEAVP